MAEYQGHRSRNAWNVALHIGNDEGLYRCAVEAVKSTKNLKQATTRFLRMTGLEGQRTPDGSVYNRTCVLEAIAGLEIERN